MKMLYDIVINEKHALSVYDINKSLSCKISPLNVGLFLHNLLSETFG